MRKTVFLILILSLAFAFSSCGKKEEKVKYAPSKVDRYMDSYNELKAIYKEIDNLDWKNEDVSDRYNKLYEKAESIQKKNEDLMTQMSREEKDEVNTRITDLDY